MDYSELIDRQRAYHASGAVRGYEQRRENLRMLRGALREYEKPLFEALQKDLNKQPYEAYLTELGVVYDELRYFDSRLKGFMKDKRTGSIKGFFPTKCRMSPEPYGVVLIVSPWNYPVNLALMPLIGAIAAGNCAVLKNSAKCPNTGAVLAELIASVFPEEYIAVVNGSRDECGDILRQRWDYIFFTGSQAGGRQVMAAAAEGLIPVTLELGGKNPVIIDQTAKLKMTARRVAFGKTVNAGQTCVAPDYALVHESVKDDFIEAYKKALKKSFRKGDMSGMVTIVNDAHYQRVTGLMEGENAVIGGEADLERRFIPPTVLDGVTAESAIMGEEVFGPVLPIITWTDMDQCMALIRRYDKPLAFYVFSEDKALVQRVLDEFSFGACCVNDVMIHAASSRLAFGGVGGSGMGQYHGRKSFDTFTHYRAVVRRHAFPEQGIRHRPYGKIKFLVLRTFFRP